MHHSRMHQILRSSNNAHISLPPILSLVEAASPCQAWLDNVRLLGASRVVVALTKYLSLPTPRRHPLLRGTMAKQWSVPWRPWKLVALHPRKLTQHKLSLLSPVELARIPQSHIKRTRRTLFFLGCPVARNDQSHIKIQAPGNGQLARLLGPT